MEMLSALMDLFIFFYSYYETGKKSSLSRHSTVARRLARLRVE
jgi:hypothetical protein